MQPSDFLTILGLGLAIWAFIPSKERRFILLFFSRIEVGFGIASMFIIHYLMSFDWIQENWFPGLSDLTTEKGIPASTWAYIIALVTIFYPIIKVSSGYFSSSRLKKLISLYETYLKENEIDILVKNISRYHINDIRIYLLGVSNLPQKKSSDIVLRRYTNHDEEYEKLVKPKKIEFAASVYDRIIQNETFVRKSANKYPELFATAFAGMQTEEASNQALVKLYIQCLFESKNQLFVQELKIMNETRSSILEMHSNVDLPILFSILGQTKVASANQVWYPVGEETLKSLKHEAAQKEFLIKKYDSYFKNELWNYKIYISIVYFNYMVRETIYRDSEWHMWLYYYKSIIEKIIEIIPSSNEYNHDSEYPSFTHYIINEIFSIMTEWLNLSREQENVNQVYGVIKCMGGCIQSISQAENSKISVRFRSRQFDVVLKTYFNLSTCSENSSANTSRQFLEKMFLNPNSVDSSVLSNSNEYLSALLDAWEEFDKVPYQNDLIDSFVNNVLTPLRQNLNHF